MQECTSVQPQNMCTSTMQCMEAQKQDATYLRSASDHVLDEITMARSINDGDVVLIGLKFPESDIDGNTTFTLGLELVQNPGILEGTLAHL